LPRPVRTQREYEQVCRRIAKLMGAASTANVATLAKYFHVSPVVFIAEPASQPPVSARPRTRTGRTSSQSVTGNPPEEQIKEA
jgi:hypothetical protein